MALAFNHWPLWDVDEIMVFPLIWIDGEKKDENH